MIANKENCDAAPASPVAVPDVEEAISRLSSITSTCMYISLSLVLFRQLLIMYVIMYMVMPGHHKVHPDIPSQRNLSMEEILKVFKISEYQI